jgi:uncharacterized membrane protein YkgB
MDTSVDEVIAASYRSVRAQLRLEVLGAWITRYGLVVVLLLIGFLKFTAAEATGIQPLVAHSPLMSWMYTVFSVQGVSNLIGVIEIAIAILLALRPISAKASFVGSREHRNISADNELSVVDAWRRANESRVAGIGRCGAGPS